jgi:hypothetical protein
MVALTIISESRMCQKTLVAWGVAHSSEGALREKGLPENTVIKVEIQWCVNKIKNNIRILYICCQQVIIQLLNPRKLS